MYLWLHDYRRPLYIQKLPHYNLHLIIDSDSVNSSAKMTGNWKLFAKRTSVHLFALNQSCTICRALWSCDQHVDTVWNNLYYELSISLSFKGSRRMVKELHFVNCPCPHSIQFDPTILPSSFGTIYLVIVLSTLNLLNWLQTLYWKGAAYSLYSSVVLPLPFHIE